MHKNRKTIFYYDEHCGLCSWGVDWLRRVDRRQRIEFQPLFIHCNEVPGGNTDMAWLYDSGKWYNSSDALIRGFVSAGFPFTLVAVFLVIPRFLRDALYRLIARNRYLFLGKRAQSCRKEE